MSHEFFVGYLPMPEGIKKRTRRVAVGILLVAVCIAAIVGVSASGYAHSIFEFGEFRTFEGTILDKPYPLLLVERPGETNSANAFSTYLLVEPFKHGADMRVMGLAGKRVRLQGELIYRDEHTMLELKPGSMVVLPEPVDRHVPVVQDLGPLTLSGEIVDSKCYLGVMNPGEGKVHRDCATRCISGGVPVAFVLNSKDQSGSVYFLQMSGGGRLPPGIAQHVGEPITLSGEALMIGDQRVLMLKGN